MNILDPVEVVTLARSHPHCDAATIARAIKEAEQSVIQKTGYSGNDEGQSLIRAAVYVMAESDLTSDEDKAVRLPYLSGSLIEAYLQGVAA